MTSKQEAAERSLHNQVNLLPRGKLLVVFAGLSLTLLISFIDQNGIGVMLPTIAKDLDASATISWAGTSSLIANTTFQMLYGRLSDIFGRKVVYLGATASLALAALLCGLSQNAAMFYVFRGVAGIGGGGLANLSMIIVSDIVTLEQRGKYQGIIGSCVGLGNVTGPFLAAAFISRLTWRAFWWLLAPLTAAVGVMSCFLLPSMPPTVHFKESLKKIDYAGVILSSIGVIFLLIPISGGGAYFNWNSPMVISMLVIGAISWILFVLWEWKGARLPMLPVQFFRNPVLCVLLTQSFLLGGVYQAYLYYLPLYLQNARQFSVLRSAAILASLVVTQAVTSIISGYYISHFKRWKEVIFTGFGSWLLGAGLALLYKRDSSAGMIVGPLILIGFGVGNVFQPTLIAVQSHVSKSRRAVVISNRNFFRCCGGAVGLAVSAAVLQAALRANLPLEYRSIANDAYSLPSLTGPGRDIVLDAFMAASRAVFILQLPLLGLCFLGCFFLKDRGLQPMEEEEEEKKRDEESNDEQDLQQPQEKGTSGGSIQLGDREQQTTHPVAK
ncbi:major facilitator superfamily domain-containing protein [Xylariaceae sp. FL1272]|nr:major facilitator superfamily domain-containing protein [Xylariaceae sp. FL1272]